MIVSLSSCLSARTDSTAASAPAAAETEAIASAAAGTKTSVSAGTENKANASAGAGAGTSAGKEAKMKLQDYTFIFNEAEPGKNARPFHTDVASAKNAVLMLYMIGSNLETERGAATADLMEIAAAEYGENLKIVFQAGGAKAWSLKDIRGTDPGRYELRDGKIEFLGSAGSVSMTDRKTLADFLSFTRKNYPADRYMLVMWAEVPGTASGLTRSAGDRRFP